MKVTIGPYNLKVVEGLMLIKISAEIDQKDERLEIPNDEAMDLLIDRRERLSDSNEGSELIGSAEIILGERVKGINALILADFNENLEKFLKKEIKSFTSHLSLNASIKELAKHGFVDNPDEFSSNGWQWDFWNYMNHPELGKICLAGSGYYGDVTVAFDGH